MKINILKSKFKIKQVIYPAILVAVSLVVLAVLFQVVKFSKTLIDGVFFNDSTLSEGVLRVNIGDYQLLARKFGVNLVDLEANETAASEQAVPPVDSVQISTSSTPNDFVNSEQTASSTVDGSTSTIDRSQIKVVVYNASGRAGEAGRFADEIKRLGYASTTAQNFQTNLAITKVQYKIGVANNIEDILSLIKSSHPKMFEENITSDDLPDVQIFIGKD